MRGFFALVQPENLIGINDLGSDGREDGNALPLKDGYSDDTVLDLLGRCLMHCDLHRLGEVRTARGGLILTIHQQLLYLVVVFEIRH